MVNVDDYAPNDQEKHLGEPPWSGPAVTEWEEAHGHDCRLPCYPEHGCLALEYERERMRDLLVHLDRFLGLIVHRGDTDEEQARELLARVTRFTRTR